MGSEIERSATIQYFPYLAENYAGVDCMITTIGYYFPYSVKTSADMNSMINNFGTYWSFPYVEIFLQTWSIYCNLSPEIE